MSLFPAFLKLNERRVLVVGGGAIAASKIPSLLEAGALVTVVAPELNPHLADPVRNREIAWLPKLFEPSDLDGNFLVIAATSIAELNAAVFEAADRRQILCNAVDDIDHCHFYYGSVVRRGDLQIAISTNGKSPALAQRLRKELEQQFGPEYAAWLDHLGATREQLRAQSTDPEATKLKLHELASRASFDRFLQDSNAPTSAPTNHSKVFLIGAGPGDPDLLTVKATRLIQSANIVLHDSLVSPEILALIPATAQRIDVGKRAGFRLLTQSDINSLLVDAATKHPIVVRLKGGDPLLFGRAVEEIEALRAHNIPFEIVPGISAAFASAAAAQVSLTDRRLASRVLFTTFSRSEDARTFSGLPIAPDTTVVVYMPGPNYAEVSRWLINSGLAPETPCAVISKASQSDQSSRLTSVAALAGEAPLPAPALLLLGRVVSQSHYAATATAADSFQKRSSEAPERISVS
jgi:uroporphyrin-III C-methyltransferase/precorrin-2 dehydrogenase/sirohydrochlorin ferrochelatase